MKIKIQPNKLTGTIEIPYSKSYATRTAFCRMLAGQPAQDCKIPDAAAKALTVGQFNGTADCGGSATILRMGVAIAGALGVETKFDGLEVLRKKNFQPYLEMLEKHGLKFSGYSLPFTMSGKLEPGDYNFPPAVSSIYVSGLLMALPLLDGDSRISMVNPAHSVAYINMTLDLLEKHGIHVDVLGSTSLTPRFEIPGGQKYLPADVECERDWSGAALWMAANKLGSSIELIGIEDTGQKNNKTVEYTLSRIGRSINVNEIPDMAPPIAAAACGYKGTTILTGCARLRYKDSDRIETIISMINSLGGEAYLEEGDIVIRGKGTLRGGTVDPRHDHRIAMAAAIASCICEEPVEILGADCVGNSYPDFFNDFEALGGKISIQEE